MPAAAVIDSQPVRAVIAVPNGRPRLGYAKKVNGRKPHIAVDVTGPVLEW